METINYKGVDIQIHQDEQPNSPREWDNFSKMVCFHSRYNLGDEHNFSNPAEFLKFAKEENLIVLPLYLYDHSGITMSTTPFSCNWDSGQVGWIYTSIELLNYVGHNWKKFSKKRIEQVKKWLISDVETYDQYLTGEVYGYSIEETGDSCYGYFGDIETSGLLDEAKANIDYYLANKLKQHYNKVKIWIKNDVPFAYRQPLSI